MISDSISAGDSPVIIQFGTSRFLQAHVDYFVSCSIAQKRSKAKVVVVQSSDNQAGQKKAQAINIDPVYPLLIQGMSDGQVVNRVEQVDAFEGALQANEDWELLVKLFCNRASHVVSNTADKGYQLFDEDQLKSAPPRSFPAKLLLLLQARFTGNGKPVTLMPCELLANNGATLKEIVMSLAGEWQMPSEFINWLDTQCIWVNSLVDRIVSEPIEPLGAVAEPYALWAIENQPGLQLPCIHSDIRVVDSLLSIEWLKLSLLNLSHSYLVDIWKRDNKRDLTSVFQAINDIEIREELNQLLGNEVVPILEAMNLQEDIQGYLNSVFERFSNPFLEHKLSDIAQNHAQKIERRVLPVFEKGSLLLPYQTLPKLRACLSRNAIQLIGDE
jgi:tagaturonate reductase